MTDPTDKRMSPRLVLDPTTHDVYLHARDWLDYLELLAEHLREAEAHSRATNDPEATVVHMTARVTLETLHETLADALDGAVLRLPNFRVDDILRPDDPNAS